jgi:hypothetical protein
MSAITARSGQSASRAKNVFAAGNICTFQPLIHINPPFRYCIKNKKLGPYTGARTMQTKIFKILAAVTALCAVIYLGTELGLARGSGGGHFSGGGAHFSGGGARFSGAQVRGFSGARVGGSRSFAHFNSAHFRGFSGTRMGTSRHFAHFNGVHSRGLNGSRIGISRSNFAHINGANVRGLSRSIAIVLRP